MYWPFSCTNLDSCLQKSETRRSFLISKRELFVKETRNQLRIKTHLKEGEMNIIPHTRPTELQNETHPHIMKHLSPHQMMRLITLMGRSSKPKRSEKMAKKGLTFYIYKHPLPTGGPTSDATAPIPHIWDHPMPSTSIIFFVFRFEMMFLWFMLLLVTHLTRGFTSIFLLNCFVISMTKRSKITSNGF